MQRLLLILMMIFATTMSSSLDSNKCGCSTTHCNCMKIKLDNFKTELLDQHCTSKIESFIIAETNLSTLGANSFESSGCRQLVSFIFRFNKIEKLDEATFNGLYQLRVLDLSHNKIATLEISGLFTPVGKSLKTLKLNSNSVQNLTKKSFQGLETLTSLEMKDNPLIKIDVDAFRSMSTLSNLSLSSSSNGRLTLPDGLFQTMTQLKLLNLTSLKLNKIRGQTFQGLDNLERLYLVNNFIGNISQEAFSRMTNLVELNLTNNRLMCFESSPFTKLNNLRHLDLSYNQLTYIPNAAFLGLDNLISLNLNKNPIAIIEKSAFCALQGLLRLDIKIMGRILFSVYDNYDATAFSYLNETTQIIGIETGKLYTGLGKQCPTMPNASNLSNSDAACKFATVQDMQYESMINENPESRRYLLIIVALCIAFLLIAFSVIMTYRAWSKRKMQAFNDEENDAAAEKQDILERQCAVSPGNQNTELAVLQNGEDKMTTIVNQDNHHPQQPNGSATRHKTGPPGTAEERQSMNPSADDGTIIQLGMV